MSCPKLQIVVPRTSGLVQDGGQRVKGRFCTKSRVRFEEYLTKIKTKYLFSVRPSQLN
jgi:hypothetical protein